MAVMAVASRSLVPRPKNPRPGLNNEKQRNDNKNWKKNHINNNQNGKKET